MARTRIFNILSGKDAILNSSDSEQISEIRSVRRSRKNRIESDSKSDVSNDNESDTLIGKGAIDEIRTVMETSDKNYRDKIQENSNNHIISVAGTSSNKSNRIIEGNNSTINNDDISPKKNSSLSDVMNLSKSPRTLFHKSKKRRSISSDSDTDVNSSSLRLQQGKRKLLIVSENGKKKSFDSKILRNHKAISDSCSKDNIFNASSTELDSAIQNKKTVTDCQPIVMDGVKKIKDKLSEFVLRINHLQPKLFDRELMTKEDAEDAIFVLSGIVYKIKGEIVEMEEEFTNAYIKMLNTNNDKLENMNQRSSMYDAAKPSSRMKTRIQKGKVNFQDNETSSKLNEDKKEILRKKSSTKNSSPSTKMESTENSNSKHNSRRDSIEKQQIGNQIKTKIMNDERKMDLTLQSENSKQYNEVQASSSSVQIKPLELHRSVSKEEEVFVPQNKQTTPTIKSVEDTVNGILRNSVSEKEEEVFVLQNKQTTPTIKSVQDTINETLRNAILSVIKERAQTPMPKDSNSEDKVIISLHEEDEHKIEKENNIIDVQETTQTTAVSKNAASSEKLNVNISDIPISVSSDCQNSVFTEKSNVAASSTPKIVPSDHQNSVFTEKSNVVASSTPKIVPSGSQNSVFTDISNITTPDTPKTVFSDSRNSIFTDTTIVSTPDIIYPKNDSSGSKNLVFTEKSNVTTPDTFRAVFSDSQNSIFSDIPSVSTPDIRYPKTGSSDSQNSVFTDKSNVTIPDEYKLRRSERIRNISKGETTNDKLNMLCQVILRRLDS